MNPGIRLADQVKFVTGLAPITPSASVPDYASLKNYDRMTAVIMADNAEGVTGSAITLLQASAVANTGEKALTFSTMYANTDTGAADTLVATAVTNSTFTTSTTNNKNLLYVIDIPVSSLDVANSFDCVRVGTANAVNTTLSVLYILHPCRYGSPIATSAITD